MFIFQYFRSFYLDRSCDTLTFKNWLFAKSESQVQFPAEDFEKVSILKSPKEKFQSNLQNSVESFDSDFNLKTSKVEFLEEKSAKDLILVSPKLQESEDENLEHFENLKFEKDFIEKVKEGHSEETFTDDFRFAESAIHIKFDEVQILKQSFEAHFDEVESFKYVPKQGKISTVKKCSHISENF